MPDQSNLTFDSPSTVEFMPNALGLPSGICRPQVPGYEILGELGRGGMGVVYQALQLGLQRQVALKMILAGVHAGVGERDRFRTEGQAIARLHHPNIVQIYEVGEADGLPFYSLEFVAGASLANKIAGAPQPGRYAADLVQALARGVQAAHEQGIIHRDLKPANVLLDDQGTPKITDFGLAKQLDAEGTRTQTGAVLGTPSYMAPEQACGAIDRIGPATDVYGLGAILYELLTGRPPFRGLNMVETLEQVRHTEPVRPSQLQPTVPRDLEVICLKCLEKELERRYASAQDLADDLRRYLGGEPIRARPLGPWGRTWKWARRKPRAAFLVATSAAVLLVAVWIWFTRAAYLDVRVSPANAQVILDGQPLTLTEGRALFQGPPGRHRLALEAPEYVAQEQDVILARGADQTVVLNIELRHAQGFLRTDHDTPQGAAIELADDSGKVVDRGVAPYHSKQLPAGSYRFQVRMPLFHPKEVHVQVPNGLRVATAPAVQLTPVEKGTPSMALLELMRSLDRPLDFPKEGMEPMTFKDFLTMVSKKHQLMIVVDSKAIKAQQPDAPDLLDVSLKLGMIANKLTIHTALRKALDHFPDVELVVVPRHVGGNVYLEITPTFRVEREYRSVLHPVDDLMDGPMGLAEKTLLADLRSVLPPEDRLNGNIAYMPSFKAIKVQHVWRIQSTVDGYLQLLRQARRLNPSLTRPLTVPPKVDPVKNDGPAQKPLP